MQQLTILIAIILAVPAAGPCVALDASDARFIDLGFADRDAWSVRADEPWWGLIDIRDVLNLFHPLVESRTDAAAGASRSCVIPADWQPPFLLRFHCADDYFADPEKHKPGMPGTESYFEHRFKQALIDDQLVWQRDVIDDNMPSSQADFEVDITPYVSAGRPFTLTLRVLDRTSTLERNERDVWFMGGTWYARGDGKSEERPRFHTSVWFADPVIGEAESVRAAPAGVRPHETATTVRHQQRWPLPPPSQARTLPANLSLVTPAAIPERGYPLTCGVPLPPGTLPRDQQLSLVDGAGRKVPVQQQVAGWWPDGSVRWLLLDATLPPHSADGANFSLTTSGEETSTSVASAPGLAVDQVGQRVTIDTGPLHLSLGESASTLLAEVRLSAVDRPALTGLQLRMAVARGGAVIPVVVTAEETRIVERGPVMVCAETSGSLATETPPDPPAHVGRFTFRLYAYAGLDTLRTSLRIYNDTKPEPFQHKVDDQPLQVTDLALVGVLPDRTAGPVMFGTTDEAVDDTVGEAVVEAVGTSVELRQEAADHFTVSAGETPVGAGARAQGWVAATGPGGCVQASLWRFWQQAPKSLSVTQDQMVLQLFAATEAEPVYLPRYGEAKRHDICFSFSPELPPHTTLTALGRLADEPPRLFDGPWFCESGALERLDPAWLQNVPPLREWIATTYREVTSADAGNAHWGLRHFGDFPYTPPMWRNGYYARVLGAVHWGLASGDQRWLERSFEMARHIADVDTVHIQPGHADWDQWHGMTCALGEDHSSHGGNARWSAFMAADQLICHYWLSGDRDSLADALAGADFLLRTMPGVGSLGVREATRPILCLLRAWQATGDVRYLEGARKYCAREFLAQHVMDWRRGTYICPLYENLRIISAGQDAMYADVVYGMYRLTGELDFAQIVVAIADSVYAESMLPQEASLGDFVFYPRYGRNSWYFPQMAVLFCQAYDLTGDLRFLRAARAAQARYLLCTFNNAQRTLQTADNFGYIDPVYAGWARALRDVPTAPFDITTMVSVPDPANFLPTNVP